VGVVCGGLVVVTCPWLHEWHSAGICATPVQHGTLYVGHGHSDTVWLPGHCLAGWTPLSLQKTIVSAALTPTGSEVMPPSVVRVCDEVVGQPASALP